MFRLPMFRINSDPSIWPVENVEKYSSYQYPGRLCVESNLSIRPSVPSSKEMTSILMSCQSFDDQVSTFYHLTRLTEQDILARFVLSDSIEEILGFIFHGTEVSIFGSVLNGLGSISSDIDLVVKLPLNYDNLQYLCDSKPNCMTSDLFQTKIISLDPDFLKNKFLYFLQRMLRKLDPLGFKYSQVYHGRVPIIHLDRISILKVGLDISSLTESTLINNGESTHHGTKMAEILHFLTLCIPEIPKSVALIKYLARKLRLTRNGPNPGFTNFKLISLFINFLQVSNYAPSFIRLQSLIENSIALDSASAFSVHLHFPDLNPFPSMEDLLGNFLVYVCSIKPCDIIIDLRNGCLTPRLESTDNEYTDHMITPGKHFILCPDPTYPQCNIWSGINEDHWSKFVQICRVLQDTLEMQCNKNENSKWGLLALTDLDDCTKSKFVNVSDYYQLVDYFQS
ncbi:hypothetical protein Smp_165320 [Schistosoma mansoni]|uniref:hypothetical protein n=1 Tax=Schistosoma mansoni TaxID=6183 RepID=UPI0001A62D26|nr:hypothetical protein Smp_165320 [Schistosoma mansoni]|eukprot:XP_018652227.1 hypothetical protein Smp_165320 [Schistosoma mansoni]